MAEHGHHCRGELELGNARWSEQSDYILRVVQGYVRAAGQADLSATHRKLGLERERITADCLRRLNNPLKRRLFEWSLRKAQNVAVTREEWKNQAVRQITVMRRMLLILGARLVKAGILQAVDDVFFLRLEELEDAVTGCVSPKLADEIGLRRREHAWNQNRPAPVIVRGEFQSHANAHKPRANRLQGIPVFPGLVTGRARVILRADEQQQVLPGEVLVAPFTDPAWTPYFVTASGAVIEQGGILSHGSIVAREYGVPTVTSVGGATSIVRTGDLVQVDAANGLVTILEEGHQGAVNQ
jgi:pyruvate,water dikinase